MKLGKLGRVAQVVQARVGLGDSRSRDVPEIAKICLNQLDFSNNI